MSESEEDELAAMRRERLERLGKHGGSTLSARRKEIHDQYRMHHGNDNGMTEEEEKLRAMFPMSFGGAQQSVTTNEKVGPINGEVRDDMPQSSGPEITRKHDELQHREEREEIERNEEYNRMGKDIPVEYGGQKDGDSNPWKLPVSCQAELESHEKAVISLDVDHSGSRVITGSTDYKVKIFDFNGMKSDCRAFRTIEPSEGHPVLSLSWSPTGDAFLVVTGSPQPKIYTRDGEEEGEFPRGDMYLRDMKNTRGHVTSCTGGQWHPTDKGCGMTCSEDGTIRVWDMWKLTQKTVIKPTLRKPGRVAVTSAAYDPDGRTIAGGLKNGTIQLWDVRGKFGQSASAGVVHASKIQALSTQNWTYVSRAGQFVPSAHQPEYEISCLRIGIDGYSMISRSTDETLKLWDIRKFKEPVASVHGLPTGFDNTQCCFSPGGDMVLTGVGGIKDGDGHLAIFNAHDLSLVKKLGCPGNVVSVCWNPKINQIFVGSGTRREGSAKVLYDPALSQNGAILAVGRRPRKDMVSDFTADVVPEIYNPNALPMYRQQWPGRKRQAFDDGTRTAKTFKPDIGQAGVNKGAGGKLGATGGSLLTQYILKNQGQLKNPAEEDVRASILRHAGKEDEFSRFTSAYKETQPERLYAKEDEEDEEDQAS